MPSGRNKGPHSRVFRTFLAGHALSSMGGKMQAAALLWHIYELTDSALALGILGAVELTPMIAFAAAGGVAADRFDRRKLLAITQVLWAIPALALAFVTYIGADTVWWLYGIAAVGATMQAFDTSARKALVPRLVEPKELARAMSAVDLTKNIAKLAGPAAMGILVASIGLAPVYLLNGVSFLLMIVALAALPSEVGKAGDAAVGTGIVKPFVDGLKFVRQAPVVRSLIALDFLATFFAGAEALLPIVAVEVLGVGAAGYGLLGSAAATGAFLGGLALLAVGPKRRLGRLALGSVALFALATIAFGLATSFWVCFIALAAVGAADTVSTVLRNTMLQLRTPDELRGRISAVNLVFAKSGPRLGQLEAGIVASAFGVGFSIVSGGVACLVAVGWMAVRYPALRNMDRAEAA